jgi:glucose-6-phosphate dehydrogenase assembly protein OpcA
MTDPAVPVDASAVATNGLSSDSGATRKLPRSFKREESWVAHTVDPTAVQRKLTRLWAEVVEERRAAIGKPRREGDAELMRTRTINLIGIADTPEYSERIHEIVTSLAEFFPSRSVILVRTPPQSLSDGLEIKLEVEEFPAKNRRTPVRFETITVAAAGGEELLASVAAPILLPELPDFVWNPTGSFDDNALLREVLDFADRLIVDTSRDEDPSRALRFLNELDSGPDDGELHLSDMAWTRLVPWRQMIAQFFDQAATQPCLDAIDDVTIICGGKDGDGRTGLTAALLLAGWLCTRLGWRAPGEELVRSRDGWKLTLRAGQRGRSREVILTLKVSDDPMVGPCVGSVVLTAGGEAPGIFKVERVSPESVETSSELSSKVSRIVYVRNLDDARLLSLELRVFGSDPIYHEALAFAANLWPEGVMIS